MKITKEILEKRQKISKELRFIDDKIAAKFTDMLRIMGDACNFEFSTWYVEGAEESEVGDLGKIFEVENNIINMEQIVFFEFREKPHYQRYVIYDNSEFDILYMCPLDWLFIDDVDEMENFIKNGVREYLKKELEAKEKIKAAKEKIKEAKNKEKTQAQTIESIKKKLTKEELKFLSYEKNHKAYKTAYKKF